MKLKDNVKQIVWLPLASTAVAMDTTTRSAMITKHLMIAGDWKRECIKFINWFDNDLALPTILLFQLKIDTESFQIVVYFCPFQVCHLCHHGYQINCLDKCMLKFLIR